jgi:hypothetical protein
LSQRRGIGHPQVGKRGRRELMGDLIKKNAFPQNLRSRNKRKGADRLGRLR